jgi:hypothetical protein
MEAWCTKFKPSNAADVCAAVRLPVYKGFENWCAYVSQATYDMEPRQAHGELRALIASLWNGLRDEQPLVKPLCQLYYDLEHPIPGRTERIPRLTREMTAEQQTETIALSDLGRAHFKRLLIEAFTGPLRHIGVRNLVIRWARIQYECMHGFQAPPTQHRERAVRDAMGLTDHFRELMDEILTQVDGQRPVPIEDERDE